MAEFIEDDKNEAFAKVRAGVRDQMKTAGNFELEILTSIERQLSDMQSIYRHGRIHGGMCAMHKNQS